MDEIERRESENALIEAGLEAKLLLESSAFVSTVNRLFNGFSESLFSTQPHESKTREMFYSNAVALQAIVDLLQQDVAVADELIEARNEAENDS